MDEAKLMEKLRRIEALYAGTNVAGEREAARLAAERIRARLAEIRTWSPDTELVYSLPDPWKRRVFIALCRRYGLRPFRRPRQRHSTVCVIAPATFQEQTLWPEYLALARELEQHLDALTRRVVESALHEDSSDVEETADPPKALPAPGGSTP